MYPCSVIQVQDLGAAPFEHRDIQGVDRRLEQHLSGAGNSRSSRPVVKGDRDGRVDLSLEPLQGPAAGPADVRRYARQGDDRAKVGDPARVLEGRHVVLHARVIGRQGGGAIQADRAVGRHQAATGSRGGGRRHHHGPRYHQSHYRHKTTHGRHSLRETTPLRRRNGPRQFPGITRRVLRSVSSDFPSARMATMRPRTTGRLSSSRNPSP